MTTAIEAATATATPLSAEELSKLDAWWRASNYLGVGMIYLQGNSYFRSTGDE